MSYARIDQGTVAEIITLPEGQDLAECYHHNIVEACVPVPQGGGVKEGDLYDGKRFTKAPPVAVEPPPTLTGDVLLREIRQAQERLEGLLRQLPKAGAV